MPRLGAGGVLLSRRRQGVFPPAVGGAAPFTPTSIAGLQAWYKADAGTSTTTDGVAISQWDDQSGNGRHLIQATGANQPLYKAAIQSGLPVVRFDGSNDGLTYDAGATFLSGAVASAFAVYIPRGQALTATNSRILAGGTAAGNDFDSTGSAIFIGIGNANTAGPYNTNAWFNSVSHASAATNATGTPRQSSIVFDGANTSMYQNATLDPVAWAAVPVFAIRRLGVGSDPLGGAASFLNGDICELLLYSAALNATDRGNVQTYLKNRWGTP